MILLVCKLITDQSYIHVYLLLNAILGMATLFCRGGPVTLIEREPRTVIHVKRAKMFDPMG